MACDLEKFGVLMKEISPRKDKIMEVSKFMLENCLMNGAGLVGEWLSWFKKMPNVSKRVALLYVMNDVLFSASDLEIDVYFQEFSKITDELLELLFTDKNRNVLAKLDEIVSVWEDKSLFPTGFTVGIKHRIVQFTEELNAENTKEIREFDICLRLTAVATLSEALIKQIAWEETMPMHGQSQLRINKEKSESIMVKQAEILIELSELLESTYNILNVSEL